MTSVRLLFSLPDESSSLRKSRSVWSSAHREALSRLRLAERLPPRAGALHTTPLHKFQFRDRLVYSGPSLFFQCRVLLYRVAPVAGFTVQCESSGGFYCTMRLQCRVLLYSDSTVGIYYMVCTIWTEYQYCNFPATYYHRDVFQYIKGPNSSLFLN